MSQVMLTVHAGAMATAANRKQSIETLLSYKPAYIEVDLRCTVDGVMVLNHDPIIVTEDGIIHIAKASYAFIRSKVPDIMELEDALIRAKDQGIGINIDMKEPDLLALAVEKIREVDLCKDVLFSGCDEEMVNWLQKNAPDMRSLINAENIIKPVDGTYTKDQVISIAELALAYGCSGLNIDYRFCSPFLCRYMAKEGLGLYVWTVNQEYEMRQLMQKGVTSITTDRPDLFLKLTHMMTVGGVGGVNDNT